MAKVIKYYDLSQPVFHNCVGWPDYPPTQVSKDFLCSINGFNSEAVKLNTHTGTHIDVPYHFFEEGKTVDQIPLDAFAGDAVFLDMRHKKPAASIGVTDIEPYMDLISADDIAILNTGWGKKRANTKEYLLQWPYLDGPAAQMLVDIGIKAVGIDTLSLGGWGSPQKGRPCHEALLGAGKVIIEEIKIPDVLMDGRKHFFSAFPILFRGCGGAFVRAVVYDFE